jgi:uncharacterized protein
MDELLAALEQAGAVDHHAHALAGPGHRFELREVLTEAGDPRQLEHVDEHPGYRAALHDLAGFLDVEPSEAGLREARARDGFEAHARRLLEACRFDQVLCDEGFTFPGSLGPVGTAPLFGCPLRRVVRLEREAEAAAEGWPPFQDLRTRFVDRLAAALAGSPAGSGPAAGLKTIAAYRSGLDLPPPDAADAAAAYDRWRRTGEARLREPALVSFLLDQALVLDAALDRPVPLQVHTGFGDRDLALHRANPSLLRPVLEDPGHAGVPVVLLHCFPYVREASYLASVYPDVHLDLSLSIPLTGRLGPDLVLEALSLAPASKLLFATDASRIPELFFVAARAWRRALAAALGRLVQEGVADGPTALRWGRLVLAGNARRIYG